MPGPLHGQQQAVDGVHTPVAFIYSSIGVLTSSTGYVDSDLYKLAYVTGDNSLWFLSRYSPPVWNQLQIAQSASFQMTMLAGTVTTNTAHSASKQTLGMVYYDFNRVGGFGGTKRIIFNAIFDCISVDTDLSAAVDINDVNGIIAFPPGQLTASFLSSSNPSAQQYSVDLTQVFQNVTGSGLIEARLWRTVSGSLGSSATCRQARLDVEIS